MGLETVPCGPVRLGRWGHLGVSIGKAVGICTLLMVFCVSQSLSAVSLASVPEGEWPWDLVAEGPGLQ